MTTLYNKILDMVDGRSEPKPAKISPGDIDELIASGLDVETDPHTGEILIRDINQNRITFIDKSGNATKE